MPLSALIHGAAKHWWLVALRGAFAVLFVILEWMRVTAEGRRAVAATKLDEPAKA